MLGIKEYYLFYNGGRGELKILLLTQILVILNLHQHKNRPKHCMSCLAGLKDSLYKVATALINKEFEDLDNIVSNVLRRQWTRCYRHYIRNLLLLFLSELDIFNHLKFRLLPLIF